MFCVVLHPSKRYFCLFQPLTMHLACVNLRMTMEESLVAATINAAASLGRAHSHGSLEHGKVADMLVIDAPRYMGLVPRGGGGGGGGKHLFGSKLFHICAVTNSCLFVS